MTRTTRFWLVTLIFALLATSTSAQAWRPKVPDLESEMAGALEAAPETIREQAGVYVLTATGYELARPSRNGFHCIVGRSQKDAWEPQCLDAEGSATLLQEILLRGELMMAGKEAAEIKAELAAAWARGDLRSPSRPGINYMLSPNNRVPVAPDRVISYGAHVMFYAPYMTNEDIGGDPRGKSPVFMVNSGRPGGYVIVPVGEHGG
ncbi:MAG: hypothetical protein AAF604_18730 [Acidobacteriota bacterium]